MGVPLSVSKCIEPCSCLIFLGLQLDLARQTVSVPPDRLLKAIDVVRELIAVSEQGAAVPRRRAQSMLGLVHFVSACCPPMKFLLNSFTDLLCGLSGGESKIRLPTQVMADLRDVLTFLGGWNGIGFFHHH